MKRIVTLTVMLISFLLPVSTSAKKNDSPTIKIESRINKTGFIGETFTYEVILKSTSSELADVRVIQAPTFPSSVRAIQGNVRGNRPEVKKEGGKTYYCWTVMRTFVIPDKKGKYKIGGSRFVAFLPQERIVSHPFWGRQRVMDYEEVMLDCKPVDFNVNALPAQRNGDFSNCVGDFSVEGWFPPGRIIAGNEAFAVFTITGFGSLENIRIPNLHKLFSMGCRLEEVDQDYEQMQRDGRLFTKVTLTCRFLALENEFKIEPLCINAFNPKTKKYYNACSDALHWTGEEPQQKGNDYSRDAIKI